MTIQIVNYHQRTSSTTHMRSTRDIAMGRQTMSSGMTSMITTTDRGMKNVTARGLIPGMDGGTQMMTMTMCDDYLYSWT